MSGPQFFHIQSFSRKRNPAGQSVRQVLEEAARAPEFSAHIEAPKPPRVILGMMPHEVMKAHDVMVQAGGVEVKLKGGKTAKRAVREDRHTLMTCVASHPNLTTQVQGDPASKEAYDEWVRLNLEFLKAKFGDRLVSVIEHVDEAHPHLHAYVLPLGDPSCSARDLNPAWAAKEEAERVAKDAGRTKAEVVKFGNLAYRAAGRELQDAYHAAVGMRCGFTRTGPKRERLSREQWKQRKEEAVRTAERLRGLEVGEERLEAEAGAVAAEIMEERHRIALEMLSEKKAAEAEKQRIEAEAGRIKEAAPLEAQAIKDAALVEAQKIKDAAVKEAGAIKAQAVAAKTAAEAEAKTIRQGAESEIQAARQAAENAKLQAQKKIQETDRIRIELRNERESLAAVQQSVLARGIAIGVRLVVGVLSGEVKWRPEEKRTEISDLRLQADVSPLKLPLKSLVDAVTNVFSGLKTLLSEKERTAELAALARKAVEAEAEAQKRADEMRQRRERRPDRSFDSGPSI